MWLVYSAFVLMVVALIFRLVCYRREIRVLAEGEKIYLAGRAEYFPALFEEEVQKMADAAGLNALEKMGGGG